MRGKLIAVAAALALISAGEAQAQTVGTPVFMAPYRAFTKYEFGGYISDPGGADWALEGFYRYGWNKNDVGFRLGVADDGNNTLFLAGADFRSRLISHSNSFPLDGALTLGLGGAFGDGSVVYIPVGFSLGRRVNLENSKVSFVPYVQPTLTPAFGSGDSDVLFTLGLGADIKVAPQLDIRLTAGVGDQDGIGIGLSYLH
ncbi:MAG TPA: outer membrane beta-barrel protein [Gemmatimonadales bacterium]|nr:outer membrane beta-barrel protein [Gemmatimonadales bacterium]